MGPLDHKQSFPEAWQPLVKAPPVNTSSNWWWRLTAAPHWFLSACADKASTIWVGQKWNFISCGRFHLFNTPNILWVHMIYKSLFISTLLNHQTKLFFTLLVQSSGKNTDTHLSKVCVCSSHQLSMTITEQLLIWWHEEKNRGTQTFHQMLLNNKLYWKEWNPTCPFSSFH